jgi:hypothetical protein
MAKSTYEYIMGHPDRGSDAGLEAAVEGIFLGSRRRYGYRRVTAELRKSRGSVNHKRVKRIMKELGLFARVPKARYSSYRGTVGKVAPNLLDRQFGAGRPYEKWVTDVTEFHLPWGKAYLSPVRGRPVFFPLLFCGWGAKHKAVDVEEGELPRQLRHGELLRKAEDRDVLRA